MTTTPETTEQIVTEQIECQCPERLLSDGDIYSADCPRHDHFPEFMKIARAAGLLVGTPTKGQIEAAAREYHERGNGEGSFDRMADHVRSSLLFRMGCALRATAGVAPQEPSEEDERITAWEAVADHPVIKPCYAEERALLPAVLDRLTMLADLEMKVNELAPAPEPASSPDREKLIGLMEEHFPCREPFENRNPNIRGDDPAVDQRDDERSAIEEFIDYAMEAGFALTAAPMLDEAERLRA